MIGDPARSLPWLASPLDRALSLHRSHALLIQGKWGFGTFEFGLSLAQGWLCEQSGGDALRACGQCPACQLIRSHTHPDQRVLLSEAAALAHGWPLELDEKRKPSRQIKVDEIRGAIDWVSTSSGRGRGKVLMIHGAEAMNEVSASALLKTLEEPPAGTRMILTTVDSARLLPTVVSRCQRLVLERVPRDEAIRWLVTQGVPNPEVLLLGAGGAPLEALAMHRGGLSSAVWSELPMAVHSGRLDAFHGWTVPQLTDTLQKICHDVMAKHAGGVSWFFPQERVPDAASLGALESWRKSLMRVSQNAEHPWSEPLLVEALVAEGQAALRAE